MNQNNNLHKEHRKRLKATYLKRGLDDFHDHNILELLLFFGIPYKDTNEIAHELINKFGSLSAVFDADIENLKSVKNMTENAAILLKLLPDVARIYNVDKLNESRKVYTTDNISEYLQKKYIGKSEEVVYLLLLDESKKIIDCISLGVGNKVASEVNISRIVKIANMRNITRVAIAHNHPDNTPVSSNDITSTQRIAFCIEKVGIKLIESYVVSGDKIYEIVKMVNGKK